MPKVHSIVITRNDNFIVDYWLSKHKHIFDTISVCDGSDDDFTRQVCDKHNVFYTTDPTNKPHHEQYCREAAFELIKDRLMIGDWVMCSQVDEWYYHDPRKVINYVTNDDELISWNQLNVLPHPSEKALYLEQLANGTYNPTTVFKHYWFKQNTKTCYEPRMFRYNGNVTWSNSEPRVHPTSHNAISGVLYPTYFHYKVFDLNPLKYKANGFASFTKSNFETGIGYSKYGQQRSINTIDDLFFDENNIYCNMGTSDDGSQYVHGYCLKIPDSGILPEDHNYNSLGNDERFLLIED